MGAGGKTLPAALFCRKKQPGGAAAATQAGDFPPRIRGIGLENPGCFLSGSPRRLYKRRRRIMRLLCIGDNVADCYLYQRKFYPG